MLSIQDKSQEVLDLYRSICKFNFFKDLDYLHQPLQANLELDELPRSKSQQFQHVPLSFSSSDNYINFWKPLFIEELKGFIASTRTSQSSSPEKFDLQSYFQLGAFKIMQFKRIKQSTITYQVHSLILLSPEKILSGDDPNHPHLVGVTYKYQNSLFVRVILGEGQTSQDTQAWKTLTTSKLWYIQSLCSLSSIERQCKALNKFNSIQSCLKEILLKPSEEKESQPKMFKIPQTLDHKLKEIYNSSQYEAIYSSLKQEGITLIQGPPGTGKTKTVLGTLSVLLQSSTSKEQEEQLPLLLRWKTSEEQFQANVMDLNPWLKSGYEDWRDQPYVFDQNQKLQLTKFYGTTTRKITLLSRKQEATAPSKVLVCGPSNASVDEVIRKLLKQKLLDGHGKTFLPKFVRVGQNYHEQIKQFSLDSMALAQQKKDKAEINACKKKVLKESQLIFSTLSSSGSSVLENSGIEFDTVVIDEAGQAVQVSSLIPLLYGCKRLILIGDPKQLPATVFSPICLQHHYDQSLFQRLMKSNYPVNLLKVQYRMHPDISKVICSSFYQGMLQDGIVMHSEPKMVPKAFMLVHIENSSEMFGEQSFYNPIEGECVKLLVNCLSKIYNDIGVLSPYSAQVKWLNTHNLSSKAEAKTIDSFQGREKQVIIFSAVRASRIGQDKRHNPKKTIGFVGDSRRLNVALSRAKELCIVIGDLQRLQISKIWHSIIVDSKKRGCTFKVSCVQQLRQLGQELSSLRKY